MEKNSKNANQSLLKQVAPIVGIFSLTILTSAILISSTAKANVTDAVAATLGASCTLDSSGTDSHTASLTGGVLTSDIGTTTLTATCNDAGGFSIFAVGYSGDAEGTTDMLSSAGSSYNIATGTATSGDASNWAMKVTPGTGITSKGGFNDYSAIPSSFTKVAEKTSGTQLGSTASATTTYQVYPSTTQAAGTYTGKVKYTLYHPSTEECPEGYELKSGECKPMLTMQTVANWRSTLTTGQSVQVLDSRDDKTYWVTKLADNRIWMTQNLDFDIDSTKTYTSADTDISANWQPSTSTYTTGTTTWEETDTEPESYDPGELCWNGNLKTDWDGTLDTETVPCTSSNMNYHIGNYYNWTAAIAMNDSSEYNEENYGALVPQSVCPAGWTLPISGNNRTGRGSFIDLVTRYGWDEDSWMMTGPYQMWDAPLSFVLGGRWLSGSDHVSSDGYYWSSVANGSYYANYLSFYHGGAVYPQDYANRELGFSVRCVARPQQKTATIAVNNSSYGSVSQGTVTTDEDSAIKTGGNIITVGSTMITATANSDYAFESWTNNCGDTLTDDCTVTANFQAAVTFDQAFADAGKSKTSGYYAMQDMSTSICSATSSIQSTQLIDSRDSKVYWVTKLADDKCWMTQNLDFDIDSTKTYTSADTDISANWTPSTGTYTTGTSTWDLSLTEPESYDPGNLCWNGNLNTDWDGTLDTETVPCTSSNMNYHIGNYYNWTAAVAMNDSSDYEDDETLVSQSICPAGWTLPTSGDTRTGSGSFINLVTQYGWDEGEQTMTGSYQMWDAPLNFTLGGSWGGSSGYVASEGYYWSSISTGSGAYVLILNASGGVSPQFDYSRDAGISVRCVAKAPQKTAAIAVNNSSYGSVSPSTVTTYQGSAISTSSNTITIGSTTVTATANAGYQFSSWTNSCGDTLSSDCTITANFSVLPTYTATISSNNTDYGTVSPSTVTAYQGSSIGTSANVLTIGMHTVTAVAKSGYTFDSWTNNCGSTLTANCTVTANFKTSVLYMQNVSTWGSTELPNVGDTVQAVDSRDNKTYWVTKLADDRIWMTQNLDFDIDSTKTYTSADTDISANWQPSTSTYTTGTSTWDYSYTTPESYDPGNYYLPNGTSSPVSAASLVSDSTDLHYHQGNYYNWTAAVAMNDSSSYTSGGTVVAQSICPAGWTLPLSGNNTGSGSFYYLLDQYGLTSSTTSGSYSIWGAPLSFALGGAWYGSSSSVASDGVYWSSVVGDSDDACILYVSSGGNVNPQYGGSRLLGFSVRCVAVP